MRIKAINFTYVVLTPPFACYRLDSSVSISECRQAAIDVITEELKNAILHPGNRITDEVYADGNCCGLPGINMRAETTEMLTFQRAYSLMNYV
jgi:hypothetical protein